MSDSPHCYYSNITIIVIISIVTMTVNKIIDFLSRFLKKYYRIPNDKQFVLVN